MAEYIEREAAMDVREKLIEILRKPIFPHELADPTEAVADYLLDSGVTVQEWVSVKDRLPENEVDYRTINTNADKIRAMSDEELAKFLNWCEAMGYEDSSIATDSGGHCMDMLEWLKQPPKGE